MAGKSILKKIDDMCDAHGKIRTYIAVYTILFVIVSLLVTMWFWVSGKTFIWYADGWSQHYRALVYYANYMRSIFKTLITQHKLIIPNWDFAIGEGGDVLQTFHYYVMGDPFAFFSFLVPTKYLYLFYDFMIMFRLYLSGLAFSALVRKTGISNRYGMMAGSFTYIFCSWSLINISRHPYFLNPLLFMPLLIIGIEKLLKKEKPYFYVLAVGISALSNFYFFYMLVLLTVIYVFARLAMIHKKQISGWIRDLVKTGLYSVFGLGIAAVVFVPTVMTFLGDARMSAQNAVHLFYPLSYYSKLPSLFVSSGDMEWLSMGYAVPALLAVFLLFQRKQRTGRLKLLKGLFLLAMIFCCFPFFAHVFNGFSYVANRWCWSIALLTAYILAEFWQDLMHLTLKEARRLVVMLTVYFIVCILLEQSRMVQPLATIGFCFLFLFLVYPDGLLQTYAGRRKQQICLAFVLMSVCMGGFWKYSPGTGDYTAEAVDRRIVQNEFLKDDTVAISAAAAEQGEENKLWRYSGRAMEKNSSIFTGMSTTQFFWSLSNPRIEKFRTDMEMLENVASHITGYDDSTILNTTSCVKYFVSSPGNTWVPYGFEKVKSMNVRADDGRKAKEDLIKEIGEENVTKEHLSNLYAQTKKEYNVYKNEHALPLFYTYSSYYDADKWDLLSAVEKQEALLHGVRLSDYEGSIPEEKRTFEAKEHAYKIQCNGNDICLEENRFVVTGELAEATITFEGTPDSETYFSVQGLKFKGTSLYDLYMGDETIDPQNRYHKTGWNLLPEHKRSEIIRNGRYFWSDPAGTTIRVSAPNGSAKAIEYVTEDYNYYNNRHDYTVNLDYSKDAVNSVTLRFARPGVYTFDKISIWTLPMTDYVESVNALKEDPVTDLTMETDHISGDIELTQGKILCIAIPYSKGWTAYVDGEETALCEANVKYCGLDLPAGKHHIEMRYHSPYLKAGLIISAFLWLLLAGMIFIDRRKQKKDCKK